MYIDFTKDDVESIIEVSDEKHTCNHEKAIFDHVYTEAMVKKNLKYFIPHQIHFLLKVSSFLFICL